jgi:UPF0716 protein FxsA
VAVRKGDRELLLKLILLLTLVPIAELYLLVRLTPCWGGFGVTVAVIILTGVLGAALARVEGLRVLTNAQREFAAGRLPADSLLDGVLILVAAALLLTPGLMTDGAGFLLLIPPSRALVRGGLKRWMRGKVASGTATFSSSGGFGPLSEEPPPGSPPMEDEEPAP